MMRKFAVALVALTFLFAGTASANYTIDLIWADTGTATLTVLPGDPTVGASGGTCGGGFLFPPSNGRCLEVRLTATSQLTASITTVGWDAATSGIVVGYTGQRSYGQYGGGLSPAAPVNVNVAGTVDCAPACDSAIGSFGGVSLSAVNAGVYTLGSISFDTSGALVGLHDILNFLRTGVDGTTDKKFNVAPVQLNGALLNVVVPEPGTASLLGLGIMGLVLAGRRRKA